MNLTIRILRDHVSSVQAPSSLAEGMLPGTAYHFSGNGGAPPPVIDVSDHLHVSQAAFINLTDLDDEEEEAG